MKSDAFARLWAGVKPYGGVLVAIVALVGVVNFAGQAVEALWPRPFDPAVQIVATPPGVMPCPEGDTSSHPRCAGATERLETARAMAARETLDLERRRTRIAYIALVLGAAALIAAAWAAVAAARSARTALGALDRQQQVSRRQARAYLHIEAVEVFWEQGRPRYDLTIRNLGQTPAEGIRLSLVTSVVLTPSPPPETPPIDPGFPHAEARWFTPLGAGTARVLSWRDPSPPVAPDALAVGRNLRLIGRLRYEDVFDDRQEFDFVFARQTAPTPDGPMALVQAPDATGDPDAPY